jgi:quercetin dioxygenase-like cupin family protein/alkylhydroperoxidase/carboxymuconolactone decarboxylase family protein YurZ
MLKKILALFMFFSFLTGGYSMAADNLNAKEKSIVKISSYTAAGDLPKLEKALNTGLDNGLTVNEIKEILVQMYAYCGFPRSLNAISTFMKVVDSRKNKNDKNGEEGKVLPKNADKFAYGDKVQVELTGDHVSGELFDFAPAIDQFLKEHLFADIFARGVLTNQEREIATISALASINGVEPQLNAHIQMGKNTGLNDKLIKEILTLASAPKAEIFLAGEPNTAYEKYFKGQSYLEMLSKDQISIANVTFEPGCRNNWHIHHKGGQILIAVQGRGYYQEWGKPVQELKPGDVVNIPAEVKHWHGAVSDSWFSHLAIEVPSDGGSTEWLEEVSDKEYNLNLNE